jgi:hypothetical protein
MIVQRLIALAMSSLLATACGGGNTGDGSPGDSGMPTDGHGGRDGSGGDGSSGNCTPPSGTWSPVSSGVTADIRAIWGSSANDIWAVDRDSTLHYTGSNWAATMSMYFLAGVSGTGPNDVWVTGITNPPSGSGLMGMTVFEHWTGSNFNDMMLPSSTVQYTAISARAPNDVWSVGPASAATHYDGSNWTSTTMGLDGTDLYGVTALGPMDAIAVGAHVFRWNGTRWTVQQAGGINMEYYYGAFGFGANDVWIVGQLSYIQHWNGSNWSETDNGLQQQDLHAIWGAAPNDIWVAGDQVFAHWNGSCWASITPPTMRIIYGLWGSGPNDIWAVGENGTILHYH